VAWAEAYLCTKWHLDPSSHLATTDIGRKLVELCPFFEEGAGSLSSTMWPGPMVHGTAVTSFGVSTKLLYVGPG